MKIIGLEGCMASEMINFDNGEVGLALNLEEDSIGAIILGDSRKIQEGDRATRTNKILEIPVTDDLLGRVVNPLMKASDGESNIESDNFLPIEKNAPGLMERQSVDQPLQTGVNRY